MKPVIILVRPQMGENIGAVARAMSNFGLSELRIAAPRDGWPNPKASDMAAGGEAIIASAKIYPDFAASLEDIHIAYATTARPRDMEKRVVEPSQAMQEIAGNTATCALVFGPERTGLTNDDIALCDTLITIPTAPENLSLNIAQSSVIVGYEWWKMNAELRVLSLKNPTQHSARNSQNSPAPKQEWLSMFTQLEEYLDESAYFKVAEKKPVMWQNVQTMLMRAGWNEQELRTWRGMLRSIWERRVK